MNREISRRRVISLSSASLFASLSGCSSLADQDETEQFTVCHLEIHNRDQHSDHTIDIHVQADGETVHQGTYDLPSATGDVVSDEELHPRDWFDGTVETLTLEGQVDDRERVGPREIIASQVSEQTEVIYRIEEGGTLGISTLVAGNACTREEQ
ncbi:hypothetical protein [Natronosalvus caseinilyticus]|uniref:hypothetical protein n=1 Tax=Natronosalvus caseinilyticus TaxID=2953747 RepID=UPI0028B07B96|nr:hypothetical protein [Natronosalvus caseinilyticus]